MTGTRPLVFGTRGSKLALAQTHEVVALLRRRAPGVEVEVREVRTEGDRDKTTPLATLGGRGVFVKELERALLDGEIDVAVHSLKDMPTIETPGLAIAAVPPRADPHDAVFTPTGERLSALKAGARVATSSPRRAAQVRLNFPTLRVVEIRGNVDTRLRKVTEGEAEALIVAKAGLDRLGLQRVLAEVLGPEEMLPAPGQGALGVQVRARDGDLLSRIGEVADTATTAEVTAERAFLAAFGSGCATPIAALARAFGGRLVIEGLVITPDGGEAVRRSLDGNLADADVLGLRLADECRAAGAAALVRPRG